MNTRTIIATIIFCLATASYADERKPIFMRPSPEAELRALQNMVVDEEDDRIVIVVWFLNENWLHRTGVRSDGSVLSRHSNPLRGHRGINRRMLNAKELIKTSELLNAMPESSIPEDPLDMLIINAIMDDEWNTKVYNRKDMPEAVQHLCMLFEIKVPGIKSSEQSPTGDSKTRADGAASGTPEE